jgi:hypothetical protein
VRSWAFHGGSNSPGASRRTQASVGAAAILCGVVIGGDRDGGDPGAGAAGAAGVVVPAGGTKSVRRRRRCAATYQACITHYRRQHYLGRYRLAVDAALAYEVSAEVLNGVGWKVNFRSRGEYEDARAREIGVGGSATAGRWRRG